MNHTLDSRIAGGAPVVALHSSASNGRQWQPLVADLEHKQDVFALDLPGYGSEMKIDELATGMGRIAQPVLSRIEQLGEPVHIVGHSFGGGVALKVALSRPDLVKSLTLYEPAVFHILTGQSGADEDLLVMIQGLARTVISQEENGTPERGMMPFVDFWNGARTWDQMPQHRREGLAGLAGCVAADFKNAFEENWALDALGKLGVPTQVLMGMESPAIAQRVATLIYQNIRDAELVMLPGLGHMAPISAPDWVNPRISQHIARIERGAGRCSWPTRRAA
jgi:pimeloyl-ACP methyl ester carboxylesterase